MKIKCVITNIEWDTDGKKVPELPKEVSFEIDYDIELNDNMAPTIADELSKRYGFCVNAFNEEVYDEDGFFLDDWGRRINEIEAKVS